MNKLPKLYPTLLEFSSSWNTINIKIFTIVVWAEGKLMLLGRSGTFLVEVMCGVLKGNEQ
jgi:hypothetical protein